MIKQEILKNFAGKKVLVTGGTGLIGRCVVGKMCDAGAKVRIVSLDEVKVDGRADHVRGDLTSFDVCKEVTKDMDCVFHLAGIKASVDVTKTKPASHFVPMLMFNTNVLEACRINKVQKVLFTSTVGAYSSAEVFKETEAGDFSGPPMDFAGWAKRMGELQIHAYKVQHGLQNFAIVRPANVYGPGDNFDPNNAMVIPSLIYRIHSGEDPVMIWGDGTAIRDFAYSDDIAEGMILALYHGTQGRYVNLGSGQGVSIRELVETLHDIIGFNYKFDATKPSGFPKRVMDISLARQMFGYDPQTSLRDGLSRTWEWYLRNQDEYLRKQNYFAPAKS
jgi:GDP-L-fucose synthase